MFDKNIKIFIVYTTFFSLSLILIYISQKAKIVLLLTKKINLFVKYLDIGDIFLKKLAMELFEY